MQAKHWILFAAGLALVVSKFVAANLPPYASYAAGVESLMAAVMAWMGATSPQLGGDKKS